jgi:hypothetical protein
MKATTWSGYLESTVNPVDEACTANHNTPARSERDGRATINATNGVLNHEGHEALITKRTVMLVLALGALAAWFAAAMTPGVRQTRPIVAPSQSVDLRGAALAAEIERRHERLRPTATPEHNRNLFQFASRAAAPAAIAAPSPVAPLPAPAPVEPPFKLIGIAEDSGTRTAILSSPAQLLMVKDGDVVLSKYRVTGISADAIELSDTSDGSVLRLALR